MSVTLLDLPLLRRFPRTPAPLLNETVQSYLRRLAAANGLCGGDLRVHLTGTVKAGDLAVDRLALVTGYPADTLRYAMPELCTPADVANMRLAGRPQPDHYDRSRSRQRPACHHCAAQRGVTDGAKVWTTHEDVVCLRHRRWIGSPDRDSQPDLSAHPDILRANRQHRRLITRHGRDRVRTAIADATPIFRQWSEHVWSDHPFQQRITLFEQQGHETYRDSAATDAATYPEIVALARLFASPYWHHQATADNLTPEPFDDNVWHAIQEEIRAGQRRPDDIPDGIRVAAAGLLHQGPALTRFIEEIQRTVNPHYRWDPWPHYRWFAPVTEWIMDEITAIRDPNHYRIRHRPLSPECFAS